MLSRLYKPKEVVQLVGLDCPERLLGMGTQRPCVAAAEPQNGPTTIDLRQWGLVAKTEASKSYEGFLHLLRRPTTYEHRPLPLIRGAGVVAWCASVAAIGSTPDD